MIITTEQINVNLGGYSLKVVAIALVVGLIVGGAGGAWWGWNNAKVVQTKETIVEKPVVVQGQHTTTTEVQYVEKATDPATGRQEATDVQVAVNKSVVTVMVNGKPYQFELLQGEQQKFEKGKIVLDQTSAMRLDVTIPTIDKTRNNEMALEITNRDISAEYTRRNLGVTVGKTRDGGIRAGGRLVYKF